MPDKSPAGSPDQISAAIEAMERIISRDPAGRNIAALVQPGHLAAAARTLSESERVLITAGFYVPAAQAGETDGPPGAKAIGAALAALGKEVAYVTDGLNAPYFREIGATPLHVYADSAAQDLLERLRPTHLVAVERLGRAADGCYYNMRGQDVSEYTEPVDELFLKAPALGITTVGVGDGGNEIGMGRCVEKIHQHVKLGAKIACVVPTDHLIVCGVSNWGAYGLAGAIGLLAGRDLLPSAEQARGEVEAIVALGGVDGVTTRSEPTVDGLPLEQSLALLAELRALI